MFEILAILMLAGLIMSSGNRIGLFNPFQLYFFIWFLVFFGCGIFKENFNEPRYEFFAAMLTSKIFSLLLFLLSVYGLGLKTVRSHNNYTTKYIFINKRYLDIGQLLLITTVPFAYLKAVEIANGVNIFSTEGFIQLRYMMTVEGDGFGVIGYTFPLAFIIASLRLYLYLNNNDSTWKLFVSLAIGFFYAYLSTGRTYILLYFILLIVPLVLMNRIGKSGLTFSFFTIVSLFVFVAFMTAKGASFGETASNNLYTLLENISSYTVAPILAFNHLISQNLQPEFGINTFRFFVSILHVVDPTFSPPVNLIKEYAYVPNPTNVYSVYEVYFRDFSYAGILMPPSFLFVHWLLFLASKKQGGIWIYIYAASVYPLVMQFFQDQYFSLMSQWIQTVFWYMFFMGKLNVFNIRKNLQ